MFMDLGGGDLDRTSLPRLSRGFDRDLKLLLFSMAARRITMGFTAVVRAIYFALLGFISSTKICPSESIATSKLPD